jgi:hypothetical protein
MVCQLFLPSSSVPAYVLKHGSKLPVQAFLRESQKTVKYGLSLHIIECPNIFRLWDMFYQDSGTIHQSSMRWIGGQTGSAGRKRDAREWLCQAGDPAGGPEAKVGLDLRVQLSTKCLGV